MIGPSVRAVGRPLSESIDLCGPAALMRCADCVSEGGLVRLRHGSWSGDWGADRFGQAPVHVFRSIATL